MKFPQKFVPHPNLKRVYYTYLGLAAMIPLVVSLIPIFAVAAFAPAMWRAAWAFLFLPLIVTIAVICFVAYWIQRYYKSIVFTLTTDEVMVERGVWWRMKQVVPYARVMSIDVIQGPISRRYGVGSAQIYTAGYTGRAGGTAGPGSRGAESSIWGVPNFVEIKDAIIAQVRLRPLFGAPKAGPADVGSDILQELKRIRKELAK